MAQDVKLVLGSNFTGPQGVQGPSGSGSQGTTGIQGSAGIQGFTGLQGTTGAGTQGIQGTTGSGTQGITGSGSPRTLNIYIDGGGAVITTGSTEDAQSKGQLVLSQAANVTGWTILGNTSGVIVVDVYSVTYAGFPTEILISGTNPPRLASAAKNTSPNINGWATGQILAGNVVEFRVNSSSTPTVGTCTVALSLDA
jgi:hypothetical protein